MIAELPFFLFDLLFGLLLYAAHIQCLGVRFENLCSVLIFACASVGDPAQIGTGSSRFP